MQINDSINIYIGRYKDTKDVFSSLDPFEDIVALISGLTSLDYLSTIICGKRPRMAKENAAILGNKIIPYIRVSLEYIDQAKMGPPNLAFLPYYYAILNLMKAYILLSYYRNEFHKNSLHHGIIFDRTNTDLKSLLKHSITIKNNGVLPLFYRTLTGQFFPNNQSVLLGNLLNKIVNIEAEYGMATKLNNPLCHCDYRIVQHDGKCLVFITMNDGRFKKKPRVLIDFTIMDNKKNIYQSVPISIKTVNMQNRIRSQLITSQLYRIKRPVEDTRYRNQILVPYNFSHYQVPEEFPIACCLYYMSSVVRYRPDYYKKLMDSKYNPMLIALRRHGIFTFLQLFWSYCHDTEIHIHRN